MAHIPAHEVFQNPELFLPPLLRLDHGWQRQRQRLCSADELLLSGHRHRHRHRHRPGIFRHAGSQSTRCELNRADACTYHSSWWPWVVRLEVCG